MTFPVNRWSNYTCHHGTMSPLASQTLSGILASLMVPMILFVNPSAKGAGESLFRLSFETRRAVISGRVNSEAVADALVAAVSQARPDLTVDRSGLVIDPSVELEEVPAWRSLISEVGLSTHEGLLEFSSDHLVIGGLTDSQVTRSALFIRAEPVLKGRALHDHICLVGTDDLPEIAVSLTPNQMGDSATSREVTENAAPPPSALDLSGLSLAKLLPTLQMLSRIGELTSSTVPASSLSGNEPLRASPMENVALQPPAGPVLAVPLIKAESFPSILFSRNSFLLQANQVPVIDSVSKQLLSPAYSGALVRLEAVKALGGSTAFNEYLCERRSAEVLKLLVERGVDEASFSVRTVEGVSAVDAGEVRILVELPPPPDPEPANTPGPEGEVAAPSGESQSPTPPAP